MTLLIEYIFIREFKLEYHLLIKEPLFPNAMH